MASSLTHCSFLTEPIISELKPSKNINRSSTSTRTGPMKAFSSFVSSLIPPSDVIRFYDRFDDYYEFTNFYLHPVWIDGHSWPTTEHYFQAQKFVGTPYYDYVRKLPFPRDAFKLSRDPLASRWIRQDWHSVKEKVMLKALRVKFSDIDLKRKLLCTDKKKLVEHTSNDSYWGDGGDGKGLNRLGELLMQVREELKNYEETNRIGRINDTKTSSSRLKRSNSFSGDLRSSERNEFVLKRGDRDFRTPTLARKSLSNSHSRKSQTDDVLCSQYRSIPSYRSPSSSHPVLSLSTKSSNSFYGISSHSHTSSHPPSREYNIINHQPTTHY